MPKSNIKIRDASRNDAQEIGTMAKEFADYLRTLGDKTKFKFSAETYMRDGFGVNPAFRGLIAEIDGKAAGYSLYHWGYDTDRAIRLIHIVDLFVREEYRGREVGHALVKNIQDVCRSDGGEMLVWEVHTANQLARKFYWKLGARYIKHLLMMRLPVKW
jgi:ribosomal protein S18 acetylase RimI-like enzyme